MLHGASRWRSHKSWNGRIFGFERRVHTANISNMGSGMRAEEAHEGQERDDRFPAMARFNVFMQVIQELANAPAERREAVLSGLNDDARSQIRRTLALFDIRRDAGEFNELRLRRLADPDHRGEELRQLLEQHYAPELLAIEQGIDNAELGRRLAVGGRTSASAQQKARQFLLRAMKEAGLPTTGVQHGPRKRAGAPVAPPRSSDQAPGRADAVSESFVAQQQRYLDQLLDRHQQTSDAAEARELRECIDRVSERLERLIF